MSENTPQDAAIKIAFATALAKVRKVPKDADNPYFKSKYQSLDAIQEMLKTVLEEVGLCYSQHVDYIPEGQCVAVTTMLWDGFGNSLNLGVSRLPFPKLTPQDAGSAFSYCQRYALRALFAVQSGEDTDAEANMGRNAPARAVTPAPASKPSPAPREGKGWDEDDKVGEFTFKGRKWVLDTMNTLQLSTVAFTGSYPENLRTMCELELEKRAKAGDEEASNALQENQP